MEYTRVTTILDPFSGYSKVDPIILNRAKERGDIVHKHAQTFIELGILDTESAYIGYLESLKKFWEEKPRKVVLSEHRFYDHESKITGQCDLVIEENNKNTLIDWKTSNQENRTWSEQGTAYKWLAETNNIMVDKVIFIKLDKTGKYPSIYEYEYDLPSFFDCCRLYNKFFKNQPDINTELL